MALYYERIQSSGSDRMEEPARKCQPIGDSGASLTLMGLTIHHSFGRYHIAAQDRYHAVAPKPSKRRPRRLTCGSDSLPRVGPLAHRIERSYGVL